MLFKIYNYYGWIELSIPQNLCFFFVRKCKKKKEKKIKTSSSTWPCSSVIIKALSGFFFLNIHILWEQTDTHTRTHYCFLQTTEQRQKDQHILLYTIHWLNSTSSIDPSLKVGYLEWEYTERHHFSGPCKGVVYSYTQASVCLVTVSCNLPSIGTLRRLKNRVIGLYYFFLFRKRVNKNQLYE